MRFEVRVKPNSSGTWVGGTWGDTDVLNVHVAEKAVDGKANRAVQRILATILGVRPRQVTIVRGEKHRSKVIELTDPPPDVDERLDHWRSKTVRAASEESAARRP